MQEILGAAFSDADQQGVLNVILPIQQHEFGIPITVADQPDLTNIPGFYQSGTGGFWVARSNDEVVGTVGVKDIGQGQAALRKMFVAAPFRGREFGVSGRPFFQRRMLNGSSNGAQGSSSSRCYVKRNK